MTGFCVSVCMSCIDTDSREQTVKMCKLEPHLNSTSYWPWPFSPSDLKCCLSVHWQSHSQEPGVACPLPQLLPQGRTALAALWCSFGLVCCCRFFLRFYFQHFFSFSAYAHMECYKKAEVHFAHRGKMICDYSYFHVLTGLWNAVG